MTSPNKNDNGNGNPPAPPSHGPARKSWYRKYASYLWVGGIVAVVIAAVTVYMLSRMIIREPFAGPTWTVKKERLLVTIVERGSLESAKNSDITVNVKAGTKGSVNASTIKWVIDDGSVVKTGDKVVDLDDSGFQDTLKTQKNTVNKAYSDYVSAKNDVVIQRSQNISDRKTAEVTLLQKELDLKKYAGRIAAIKIIQMETREQLSAFLEKPSALKRSQFEADVYQESEADENKLTSAFLQDISDLVGKIETARSDRESWIDRASWSQRMFKKGFYSLSQSDADKSRLDSMEITLKKVEGDLDIYSKFDLEKNITQRWSDVKEAERALKRVLIQADAQMEKKEADEASKKAILDQELDRLSDMQKEEKFYKITAPQNGLVVYFVPEQSRGGSGSQQSIVAQGEPVREGQKIIRIPNLKYMMVNARVHEAMVSKLRGEETKPTSYAECLRLSFGLGSNDLNGLLTYQIAFDKIRDKHKDKGTKWFWEEQHILYPGQEAKIRVDAHPGKQFSGHVKTVATVASQADFLSSDVKVYQTMVSIENLDDEKLRPGMSAEVTILADHTSEDVLVIPIQSVVGNVAMGEKRKCYVLDERGFAQERDIVVGKSSDKMVEVHEGLKEGEKIVLNPRPLIPEKSDMKPGTPGTRRGADFEEGKKGKKGGKGGPSEGGPSMQRPDASPSDAGEMKKKKK